MTTAMAFLATSNSLALRRATFALQRSGSAAPALIALQRSGMSVIRHIQNALMHQMGWIDALLDHHDFVSDCLVERVVNVDQTGLIAGDQIDLTAERVDLLSQSSL